MVSKMAAGTKISKHDAEMKEIEKRYNVDWETYSLKDGIYRSHKVEDELFYQLVLPESLWELVFWSTMMI